MELYGRSKVYVTVGIPETSVEADGIFFAIFALDRVADFAVIWLLNCATPVIMAAAAARNDSATLSRELLDLLDFAGPCWPDSS